MHGFLTITLAALAALPVSVVAHNPRVAGNLNTVQSRIPLHKRTSFLLEDGAVDLKALSGHVNRAVAYVFKIQVTPSSRLTLCYSQKTTQGLPSLSHKHRLTPSSCPSQQPYY